MYTANEAITEKITMRRTLVEKLENKVVAIDQQIAVLENAKKNYLADIERKTEGLTKLEALLEITAGAEEEIRAIIEEKSEITSVLWLPGMDDSLRPSNNPRFRELSARLDSLVAMTDAGHAEKEANKIYYGKA